MPEIVNPETHHEKSDVNVRALLWATVIFIIFGAATHLLLYTQFRYYRTIFRGKTNAPLTSVARPRPPARPPEARSSQLAARSACAASAASCELPAASPPRARRQQRHPARPPWQRHHRPAPRRPASARRHAARRDGQRGPPRRLLPS